MKFKYLVGFLCLLASSVSFAFQTKITDTYAFGDGDSKASVREVLLERIKRDAANQAGSYIQSDKTFDSKGYRESIRTISASIVKIKILSEKTGVNKSGSFYLRIVAHANVDEKELKKRIAAIQSDKSKDKVIKSLSKEKASLLQQMAKLEKALKNKALTSQRVSEILADQSEVTRQLSANDSAVSKVFKRGSLISMAKRSGNRSQEVINKFKKDYQRYWDKYSRKLNPRIESVEGIKNDRFYEVTVWVPIDGNMPSDMRKLVSNRALGNKDYTVVKHQDLEKLIDKEFKADILSRLSHIGNKYKSLVVSVGGKKKTIYFFGLFEESFFGGKFEYSNKPDFSKFKSAANNIGYTKQAFGFRSVVPYKDNWYIQGNDFVIKFTLTAKEAEAANKVTAYFK